MCKFIFVTGGVASGIGKGVIAASVGRLFKESGYRVNLVKLDPYLNCDPGTLNPNQHGEVYVTEDGTECDLDLGHYSRIAGVDVTKHSSITAGMVYQTVLNSERQGLYEGRTVQVIPDVTQEIKRRLLLFKEEDIVVAEIGGTVGDIEGEVFLEAARQLSRELKSDQVVFIHLVWLPRLTTSGEFKSKPAQHSLKLLQQYGIHPHLVIGRSDIEIPTSTIDKLKMINGITQFVGIPDVQSIYDVPDLLLSKQVGSLLSNYLSITYSPRLTPFFTYAPPLYSSRLALIAKYHGTDAYISIYESLKHAGRRLGINVEVDQLDSDEVEQNVDILRKYQAVIIPGGFGTRGIEGKIAAARYCRINNIPLLGICLGFQCMIIDWAREQGLSAHTTEVDPSTEHPVIDILPDKKSKPIGGTLRLGAKPTTLEPNTLAYNLYTSYGWQDTILERHRHRYELNPKYHFLLDDTLIASGIGTDNIVEVIEHTQHKFYVGTQYHPEFKSSMDYPHPLFLGLLRSTIER